MLQIVFLKFQWKTSLWGDLDGEPLFFSFHLFFLFNNGQWQWPSANSMLRASSAEPSASFLHRCQPPASPRSSAVIHQSCCRSLLKYHPTACRHVLAFSFCARHPKLGYQVGIEGSRLENGYTDSQGSEVDVQLMNKIGKFYWHVNVFSVDLSVQKQ